MRGISMWGNTSDQPPNPSSVPNRQSHTIAIFISDLNTSDLLQKSTLPRSTIESENSWSGSLVGRVQRIELFHYHGIGR